MEVTGRTNRPRRILAFIASMILFTLALAILSRESFARSTIAADKDDQPLAVLPMEIINNRVHVLFEVRGVPVQMLLDTGASVSVLFESETLLPDHFVMDSSVDVSFPAFRATTTGFRLPPVTLTAGAYEFRSHDMLFINKGDNVSEKLGKGIDGILGRDFFEAQIVAVDPVASVVTLLPNGTRIAHDYRHRHALYMDGDTPYITHRSKLPWETLRTKKKLLLDTGYPGGVVFWDQKQFLQATNRREREDMEAENKGVLYFGIVRFGKLIFRNIPIFISPDAPQKVNGRDGIIGATMFRPFRYAIDFNRGSLWLDPVTKSAGIGYQIPNNVVYTPGNEKFVVKKFAERPSMAPKTTIVNDRFAIPE